MSTGRAGSNCRSRHPWHWKRAPTGSASSTAPKRRGWGTSMTYLQTGAPTTRTTTALGPPTPFGTATKASEQASIYASYKPAPVNTSLPTITGTAQQGQTLTEHHGSWTHEPTSYSYQWLQCDNLGGGCLA